MEAQAQQLESGDVIVTSALIDLMSPIKAHRAAASAESDLCKSLGVSGPEQSYESQISRIVEKYASPLAGADICLKQQTFKVLLHLDLPPYITNTRPEDLRYTCVFNPFGAQGYGTFRRLGQ